MTDTRPTLQAVERYIRERHKQLTFPDWLERQFEADTRDRRTQRLRAATLANVVIYNLFLVPDWFLIPDAFWLALLLHAAVVTPWIVLVGWVSGAAHARFIREGAAASMPIAIVLQILCLFVLTTAPDAGHYQYFVLLVVVFTNTIQRLPYHYATVVSTVIVVLQATAVAVSGRVSGPAAIVAVMTLAVAAYLTLTGNYYLERDFRRAYLHALRDRLRRAEAELASRHDALTNLANRHFLAARLEELWSKGDGAVLPVAVIMLDIDHFKAFNDRNGHVAGDGCLKRVAACLSAELRDSDDLAVRYGGEEFMVLLPNTDLAQALTVAERIRRAIEVLGIPHDGNGARGVVTASLGVAAGPVSTMSAAEIVMAADAGLYAAKRNGRNQVWPRRASMDETAPTVIKFAR